MVEEKVITITGDDSTCSTGGSYVGKIKGSRTVWEVTLLGIALIIGNHLFYWTGGLIGGVIEYLLTAIMSCFGYLCLTLCLAEITSALPFGGGLYGMTRVTLGPYFGFIVACCEMLQSIVFTTSLLFPAGLTAVEVFGLPDSFIPFFWILMLGLCLMVNIMGVKYFWRTNTILVLTAIVLFIIYYAVWMPCMDCKKYGGGILMGIPMSSNWLLSVPAGSLLFAGLELLPMACTDAIEPSKTLPQSFLGAFVIISLNAFLLIFAAGCNAPGSFFVGISIDSPLYYGFVNGLHVSEQVGKALLIPILFTTSCAFTYVYGIQLRSMADSGLLPGVLQYSYGPDRIPYVALLCGAANAATRQRRRMANYSQQVPSYSAGLKGKSDKNQAINKGILSGLIKCFQQKSVPTSFRGFGKLKKEQSSVQSSTINVTTMIEFTIQEGNRQASGQLGKGSFNEDQFHRIGEEDETCPEHQAGNDNATSTISGICEKTPLFSISSELMENIVKKRPGYKPHEKHVNPRCAIVPDHEVENMLNNKSGQGQGNRCSSELRQSTLLGLRPSASKSGSIDDDIRSALVVPTIHDEEVNEDNTDGHIVAMKLFRSSSKPNLTSEKVTLRKSIQDHLSQYLPSPELLFQDRLFEEKVEEMLLKKSLSLGSSLESSESMDDEAVGDERGKLDDECNDERSLLFP
eukprot:scaffold3873_cov177-Ochromonas_danica.AAC.15